MICVRLRTRMCRCGHDHGRKAWPITWLAMNRWLDNFAYRISIQLWMFVLAAILAMLIALATISFQAIRAALADPVNALKYE